MLSQRNHKFALGLALGAVCLLPSLAALANPCRDKLWVDAPVLALGSGNDQDGIGGTGHGSDAGDGIGGTGHTAPVPTPDRGFVGVIAGFASICVNGAEIHFGDSTPIFVDGQAEKAGAAAVLALGQMVTVSAGLRDGELHAARIEVLHSVVGPIDSIQPESGTLTVLGQSLRVTVATQAVSATLGQLKVGDHVAVSGSRLPSGEVLVTRLTRRAPGESVSLLGFLRQDGEGGTMIGTQSVLLPQTLKHPAAAEREVLLRGTLKNGVLQAESLMTEPRLNFGFPVRRIDLQGYLHRQEGSGRVNISGTDLVLRDMPLPAEGSRIHIEAVLDGEGRLVGENLRGDRLLHPEGGALVPQRSIDRNLELPANLPNSPNPPNPTRNENGTRPPPGELSRPATIRPDLPRPELLRPEILRPERPRPGR